MSCRPEPESKSRSSHQRPIDPLPIHLCDRDLPGRRQSRPGLHDHLHQHRHLTGASVVVRDISWASQKEQEQCSDEAAPGEPVKDGIRSHRSLDYRRYEERPSQARQGASPAGPLAQAIPSGLRRLSARLRAAPSAYREGRQTPDRAPWRLARRAEVSRDLRPEPASNATSSAAARRRTLLIRRRQIPGRS